MPNIGEYQGFSAVDPVEIQKEFGLVAQLQAQGRIRKATKQAKDLTRRFPNLPETHNQLGELLLATGANEEAANCFKAALKLSPEMVEAHNGLGNALEDLGLYEEAIASYRIALRHDPNNPETLNNLGNALDHVEQFEEAASCYGTAVRLCPQYAELHLNLGNALDRLKRHEEAIVSYQNALRIEPRFAEVFNDLGLSLDALSEHDQALKCYLKALELKPDFPKAINNLGHCLYMLGRDEEAVNQLQAALKLMPDFPEAHHNLGFALDRIGRVEEAVTHYKQALELRPNLAETHSGLCQIYERSNSVDEMRQAVANAKAACDVADPHVRFCEAQLANMEKRREDAREVLSSIGGDELPYNFEIARRTLLGKICDRLGDYQSAFAEMEGLNRLISSDPKSAKFDPDLYLNNVKSLTESWSAPSAVSDSDHLADVQTPSKLVFLIGFPRSGTTLLDTIMRSHPEILVAEELPMVSRMREHIGKLPTKDVVEALTSAKIDELREIYFTEFEAQLGDRSGASVVIDKLPLNLIEVGLIHRVFPDAKYILALRHPFDCVLSCFMQNFQLNQAMANFLELERTANLYDGVMSLWCQYQNLNLEVQSIKYEQLVHDLRGTAEPLVEFFGLDWHDDMEQYRETALSRERINTPSYNQVTEPLYHSSIDRWRNYSEQLAPVSQILQPWVQKWGYET